MSTPRGNNKSSTFTANNVTNKSKEKNKQTNKRIAVPGFVDVPGSIYELINQKRMAVYLDEVDWHISRDDPAHQTKWYWHWSPDSFNLFDRTKKKQTANRLTNSQQRGFSGWAEVRQGKSGVVKFASSSRFQVKKISHLPLVFKRNYIIDLEREREKGILPFWSSENRRSNGKSLIEFTADETQNQSN